MIGEERGSLRAFPGVLFAEVSLAAGVVNGLLGAGGGIIILYLIRAQNRKRQADGITGDGGERDSFATVVAVMLPVSLVSALSYASRGNIDLAQMAPLAIPAMAGGTLGAYLTDRLPVAAVRAAFALLVIFSGIRMLL